MVDFTLISVSIIQFLIISIICYYEAQRKSPAVFLWATLEIMFGVMHLITIVGNSIKYSWSSMFEASIFVIIFCIIYLFIRIIINKRMGGYKNIINQIVKLKQDNKYTDFLMAILNISIVLSIYYVISFSGGLLNTSWSEMRDYSSSLGYVNSSQLLNILYFSTSGVLLINLFSKKYKKTICSIVGILIFALLTRNRILILPLLVDLILFKLTLIKHIKIKNIFFASIIAVMVIYVVYGIRVFRHYGSLEAFIVNFNLIEFVDKINLYLTTDNGELGLRNGFYYFIECNNNFPGFGVGASYMRMLLVYLPTQFSFDLKPDDFAITMGQAIGMAKGGSTHPTLFGDCYANAGFFGVFLGIFWGLYASIVDFILIKTKNDILKILFYSLFSVTFVIMGRGSVYNSFFFVAWGIPTLLILDYIYKFSKKIKFKIKG